MKRFSPTGVLITGASSGIGSGLAEAYANPESTLFLSGRNEGRLEHTAKTCREKGATVHTQVIDVKDAKAMRQWVLSCDKEQPLELVIANAGISSGADSDIPSHDIFATNVDGVLNTIQPLIPVLQARRCGQIAIMSSLAGLRKLPSAPAYSASKVAIRVYGEALREQLAGEGVDVSVIMPGFVESRITDKNDFAMPMIMPAWRAAQIIKSGLQKNRARIAFPFPLYALMLALAALPSAIYDAIVNRLPKKA